MRPTLHANTRDKHEKQGLWPLGTQYSAHSNLQCSRFPTCILPCPLISARFLYTSRGHNHSDHGSNDFLPRLLEIYRRRRIRDLERDVNSEHKHRGAGQSVYLLPLPRPIPHRRTRCQGIGLYSLKQWRAQPAVGELRCCWDLGLQLVKNKWEIWGANSCQLLFKVGHWLISEVPSPHPHR